LAESGRKNEGETRNAVARKLFELAEKFGEIEADNVTISVDELTLLLQPQVARLTMATAQPVGSLLPKAVDRLPEVEFAPPIETYPAQVAEVQLGATSSEGGTRSKVVKIGGGKTLPFYGFEGINPNRPAFAMDVFDMPIHLVKAVKQHFEDVMGDPTAWARKCVEFGADVVSFNLVSTDPGIKDTKPEDAANTVEDVLRAVDVPVIIGGSGNKQKDPLVLEKAAEVAHGEKCLLNSVSTDTDYKKVVKAALEHGHSVVAFTPLDINNQKKLNRLLLGEGLPKTQIVMDPTTGALGYGIEYSVSLFERVRLGALMGDSELQMPILSAASNAWGAREAWMKAEDWGPREFRGPLWETVTALTMLMSGADLFMVSNPATVRVLKQVTENLCGLGETKQTIESWITALG
jgi:acetyl-CoA decarbonylase/synthase complex subunit delta